MTDREPCANCGETIRAIGDNDVYDPRQAPYAHVWVDSNGNEHTGSPVCDLTLVATPKRGTP